MASDRMLIPIPLTGRLNEQVSPVALPQGDFVQYANIDAGIVGELKQRLSVIKQLKVNPWATVTDTSTNIYNIAGWYDAETVESYLFVAKSDTKLIGTQFAGTWKELKTGLGTTIMQATPVSGYIIVSMEGVNTQIWDGVAVTSSDLGGSPPQFAGTVFHERSRRLFGFTGKDSTLYFSGLNAITDWTIPDPQDKADAAGSLAIFSQDSDVIKCIVKSYYGDIYIFKGPSGSIHRLTGSGPTGNDAYRLETISHGINCLGPNGAVVTSHDIFWISNKGIHSLSTTQKYGNTEDAYLSAPIKNTLLKIDDASVRAASVYVDAQDKLMFLVPIVSANPVWAVYDIGTQKWSIDTIGEPSGGSIANVPIGAIGTVFAGDRTDNKHVAIIATNQDDHIRGWPDVTDINDSTDGFPVTFKTGVLLTLSDGNRVLKAHERKQFHALTAVYKATGETQAGTAFTINVQVDNQTVDSLSFSLVKTAGGTNIVVATQDLSGYEGYSVQIDGSYNAAALTTQKFTLYGLYLHASKVADYEGAS